MNKTNLVSHVLELYKSGQRHFENLDIEDESFAGHDLQDIIFENCSLYVSFQKANLTGAKFLNGGVKACNFREADLTNARFENVCVESALFAGSNTDNTYFNNNSAYGQLATQADFDAWVKDVDK